MSQWISVNDRLPEDGEHCIVWDGDWMQGATYYEEEKAFYFDDLYESDVINNASHWMPFPEPPESEAEK